MKKAALILFSLALSALAACSRSSQAPKNELSSNDQVQSMIEQLEILEKENLTPLIAKTEEGI